MINIADLLNPKNDYVFKRIFGYTGNEEITQGLLQAIIPDKINRIELDANPITEKDLFDDKIGILDIKAKLNDGDANCDIEMQMVDQKDIEKRILFYWSKMYTQTINVGKQYEKLKRCIVILITDYNIKKLREIPEYVTKWQIREEKYTKIVLTNVLELYIIETEKAKDIRANVKEDLYNWIKFINNPEEESEMENKEIKQARKVLEEISQDERERRLTELREKYRMDQHAIMLAGYDEGLEAGIEQGIKQGIEQGIAQGSMERQKEIAKKLLELKMPLEEIITITELSKEEIEKLKIQSDSKL